MPGDAYEATEVTTGDGETTVKDSGGRLGGAAVATDGTNDATLECYDGTVAAGTLKLRMEVAGADLGREFSLPGRGTKFTSQLNVQVTGTGASAVVFHGS